LRLHFIGCKRRGKGNDLAVARVRRVENATTDPAFPPQVFAQDLRVGFGRPFTLSAFGDPLREKW
jgi:hypothetical protein